jgi:DNA helicase HerA-like ATPase
MRNDNDITYIGRTTFRNEGKLFGIRRADRRHHMYIIGKTGTGKSTLIKNMVEQDLGNGEGLALFDPHGDLVEEVVRLVPESRRQDVVYLDVPNPSCRFTFNPLAGVPPEKRALAAAGMVEVFKKLWPDDWGPRLEHLLRNVVWVLLETPGASLGDIPRLLTDRDYRRSLLAGVTNPEVVEFWKNEFERYSPAFRAVVVAPLQNKVGGFLTDPRLRDILSSPTSTFDLRAIMDERRVLLVNLSRGEIGEGPAALLGSLLVSSIALAGFARAGRQLPHRRDFWIYLDEFQTFATLTLASMLSELRKYRVALVLGHQYLSQLAPEVRDALFGNVGSIITFRIGAADAAVVSRELGAPIVPSDITSLARYCIYVRLMVTGECASGFSAQTEDNVASMFPTDRTEHLDLLAREAVSSRHSARKSHP